ncbi:MAG: GGDEF domain-containing protein [Planctomycetota bacterium]
MSLYADHLSRAWACAAAGAGCAAAGLYEPELIGAWSAAGCVVMAAIGWWRIGFPGASALMPAAALLPGGEWTSWAGWTAAGLATATGSSLWLLAREDARVQPLRRELRDAERERVELERQIRRFPMLLDACVALSAARELDQFATVLAARAKSLAPEADEILVFLARGGAPVCRAGISANGQWCQRAANDEECFVTIEARVLIQREAGRVRVLAPLRADRRQVQGAAIGEAPRGALSVSLTTGVDGARVAIEQLQALARLGGIALAAVELVEQARGMALRDDLTGLLGRHEFLRRLEEQIAFSRRVKSPLALVMCDLDHLKRFNDAYGHAAGDTALRTVAQAMERALPKGGLCCRWGGEEFSACVQIYAETELAALGETIRAAVEAAVPDPQHSDRRVTTSIGMTLLHSGETAKQGLERADQACYRAKREGRNRVVVQA